MLVPITRQKLEELIPVSATAEQYRYYWGKFPDFLQRLLISVISVVVIWVIELAIDSYKFLALPLGIAAGLYWLWSPVLWAGLRNAKYRKYPYAGFWRGEVLDVFVTEELVGKEETVNDRGELVIVENRERRINLEIGDESGFTRQLQATLQKEHQRIAPGQVAELLVLSKRPDLERIAETTDVYIPSLRIWVSDYPYLKRDTFEAVSRQLSKSGSKAGSSSVQRRRPYSEDSGARNDGRVKGYDNRRDYARDYYVDASDDADDSDDADLPYGRQRRKASGYTLGYGDSYSDDDYGDSYDDGYGDDDYGDSYSDSYSDGEDGDDDLNSTLARRAPDRASSQGRSSRNDRPSNRSSQRSTRSRRKTRP